MFFKTTASLTEDLELHFALAWFNFEENGTAFAIELMMVSVIFTIILSVFTQLFSFCGSSPKFAHYNIKALWHLTAMVWGFTLLRTYSWGFTNPCTDLDIDLFENEERILMRPIYIAQCGYYIGSILVTLMEGQRGDITAVIIHHVITFFLIGFSWFYGHHRWGLIVYFWVDFGDAVLYYLKVIQMFKKDILTATFFLPVLVGFFYSKVYHIYRLSYQAAECVSRLRPTQSFLSIDWAFSAALFGLATLMVWYTYKLIMAGLRFLQTGEAKDTMTEKTKKE